MLSLDKNKLLFQMPSIAIVFKNITICFCLQSGRVLVTGRTEDMMTISGRVHNANDIIATILAVEPVRFVHKSRCA